MYVLIFAGVVFYAVVTGRYNLLLYCAIFVLYALGLLAKPMLVTLPCVCLLLDFWPLGRFPVCLPVRRCKPPWSSGRRVPRRKAKRNQRLPARKAAAPAERAVEWTAGTQILLLLLEKVPLLALSAASAVITPYAQAHGGSMASSSELSIGFRLENSLQSYMRYITRMFWPGKMSVLYLLDPDHVNHFYTAVAVVMLLTITGLVIWAAFYGRRYLALGWFWYVGTLVPVIGIVQVGEQTHADRYTYIPYIGLFIMLAWGIADLIALLPQFRTVFRYATGFAMMLVLATCVGWTKYQLQFWTGVEVHLRHALTITPDNWNMLNNLGVYLWKQAQKQDVKAAKAEAEGDLTSGDGIPREVRRAERRRHGAVDPRHHRASHGDRHSQQPGLSLFGVGRPRQGRVAFDGGGGIEADFSPAPQQSRPRALAEKPEVRGRRPRGGCQGRDRGKGKTTQGSGQSETRRRHRGVRQGRRIGPLAAGGPLEPRRGLSLALGVAILEKAEFHFLEILELDSISVKDRETINNFSQAYFGLARVALARNNSDAAIKYLIQALERNPQNPAALQLLAVQQFERGEYREGEKCLWPMLAGMPAPKRRELAEHSAQTSKTPTRCRKLSQPLTSSPGSLPQVPSRESRSARGDDACPARCGSDATEGPAVVGHVGRGICRSGQFPQAVQAAQIAINLANAQGNRPLTEAISQRLPSYQQGKPYRCRSMAAIGHCRRARVPNARDGSPRVGGD